MTKRLEGTTGEEKKKMREEKEIKGWKRRGKKKRDKGGK